MSRNSSQCAGISAEGVGRRRKYRDLVDSDAEDADYDDDEEDEFVLEESPQPSRRQAHPPVI